MTSLSDFAELSLQHFKLNTANQKLNLWSLFHLNTQRSLSAVAPASRL